MELSTDTAFWLFVTLGVIILLGIHSVSRSIGTLVTSKDFQDRLAQKREKEGTAKVVALLLMLGTASESMASFITDAGESFMSVGAQEVWTIAIIDAILLIILVYLRSQFNGFVKLAYPEVVAARKKATAKKTRSVLTDRVAIEEEHTILMDHDYDGIQELDNNLPPWWKYGFYLTIVVAVVYLANYHVLQTGDLQIAEYKKDMVEAEIAVQEYLAAAAMNVDETSVVELTEAADLNAGKALFNQYCKVCHLEDGGGLVGPNLTDDHWIYGPDIKTIFKTVKYGANNGMKSWQDELNPVQMQQVSSYIRTLHGTTPANPKEPQGTIMPFDPEVEEAVADSLVAEQ